MTDRALQICDALQRNINASPYRVAAQAIGFTFGKVQIRGGNTATVFYLDFSCVCGKRECISVSMWMDALGVAQALDLESVDMVERIARNGSFSKAHLLDDGYDEDFANHAQETFEVVLDALMRHRNLRMAA